MSGYREDMFSSLRLFCFPNYMGTPAQVLVKSRKEALEFALKRDGLEGGIHIRANSIMGLDKLVFEVESPNVRDSFRAFESFVGVLEREGFADYSYYFFSGNKSFYIYILLQFLAGNEETVKYIYRRIYERILERLPSDVKKFLDPNFINPYHLVRLPNSVNEKTGFRKIWIGSGTSYKTSGFYSKMTTPIPPPSDKLCLKDVDIWRDVSGLECGDRNGSGETPPIPAVNIGEYVVGDRIIELLKEVVRPIIYNSVLKPNPPHIIRTAFVSELMCAGFTEEEVCEIIRFLNWEDYDEKITKYHVHKIFEKKLMPPRTSTLIRQLRSGGEAI